MSAGRTEQLRQDLCEPGKRALALETAARLDEGDLQQLFPDLLELASFVHGLTVRCRELILRLPRPWLLTHLEGQAELYLAAGGYEEYRALLTLNFQVDQGLTRRLAERALRNADPDIHEAGEDFLRLVEERENAATPSAALA
jgi:hypothetical protein